VNFVSRLTPFESDDRVLLTGAGVETAGFQERLSAHGFPTINLHFCFILGKDSTEKRMEILELAGHPYYVAVQYHPEFLSRPLKPSAPFKGLILAAVGRLSGYLSDLKSRQLSPAQLSDEESSLVIVNGIA